MIESIPAELHKPLLEEFRRGWHKEMVLGAIEAKRVGAQNQSYHKGVDGLGQLRARIPFLGAKTWLQMLARPNFFEGILEHKSRT